MRELVTFTIALLTITNPIGTTAIYAGLVKNMSAERQRRTARTAAIAILVILVGVAWTGESVLNLFGVSMAGFETAGGIILVLLGLSMLHGNDSLIHHSEGSLDENADDSIAVVPVAMPIVAGPGAITTVIVATHNYPATTHRLVISGICAVVALLFWTVLHFATPLSRRIGPQGIGIASRAMGIILMAIAVQMMANGLSDLLPGLARAGS